MCQTFLPLLIKAQGTIVQIGSVAGVRTRIKSLFYRQCVFPTWLYTNMNTMESRSFPTCSARSTTPPRRHYTLSVILCVLNLPHSGMSFLSIIYHSSCPDFDHHRVKVTTVITGGVQSRIARVKRVLPPTSLYRPIEAEYNRRVSHSQEGAMPHDAYARSVVTQVLYGSAPWRWLWPWAQGSKKWIWEGNRSWIIRFVTGGWLWFGLFDRVFTNMFNLWKLRGTWGGWKR